MTSKEIISRIKENPWTAVAWILIVLITIFLTLNMFVPLELTWSSQIFGAFLGALVTIIATRLLLDTQSKNEEESNKKTREHEKELQELEAKYSKELKAAEEESKRELELYIAKLKVYSNFVEKMFTILRDDLVSEEELMDLRTRIFGQLCFYAKGDILSLINDKLKAKTVANFMTNIEGMQQCFVQIASILQKDLNFDLKVNEESAAKLWNTFNDLIAKIGKSESISDKAININSEDSPNNPTNANADNPNNINTDKLTGIKNEDNTNVIVAKHEVMPLEITKMAHECLKNTYWHFNMLGEEQIEAIRNLQKYHDGDRELNLVELNLIEYGEDWRTGLIKQVKENNLVFLFRRGGAGYMGVYRAVGWKIFEFKADGTTKEKVFIFGRDSQPQEIDNPSQDEIERSDIYESKDDGATLCSSLIVEPLAFTHKGIGNEGGTYRRTISRYDNDYGMTHLACFAACKDDDPTMGCNKVLFEQILASGNIKPAQRDENGNWKFN